MKRFFLLKILLFVVAFVVSGTSAWAQDNRVEEEEQSWVLSFIESQLSTPSRQIRLHNIEGSFSSSVQIGEVTFADSQGVWLRAVGARIDWNRSALLLGRVSINEVSAERIEFLRQPLAASDPLPDMQAHFFSLPQLPVAVEIGNLSSPLLLLGEDLFGRSARLSLDGFLNLDDGNLTSHFAMREMQGSGYLELIANYDKQTNIAKLDFILEEPENGLFVNLLALEGRPAITMSMKGEGEVSTLEVDLMLAAAGKALFNGQLRLQPDERGQAFTLEAGGALATLLSPQYQDFFGQETRLDIAGIFPLGGGWQLEDLHLTSGEKLDLKAQAVMGRDGFLRRLNVQATSSDKAQLTIAYGLPDTQEWHGHLTVAGLQLAGLEPVDLVLDMGGRAENLDDASRRRVSLYLYGGANRIGRAKLDNIDEITILLDMAFEPQQNLTLNSFDLGVAGAQLNMAGQFENGQFDGALKFIANDLSPLATLMDQEASGKVEVTAQGQIDLFSGAFNLDLTGSAEQLASQQSFIDRLTRTGISLNGNLKRDEQGLHFDKFFINSDIVHFNVEGSLSNRQANLDVTLDLADLVWLDERLRGGLSMKAVARGHNGFINWAAHAEVAAGTAFDQRLTALQLDFNGFMDRTQAYQPFFRGQFNGQGQFAGQALALRGDVSMKDKLRRFDNLLLTWGRAQIAGYLDLTEENFFEGSLEVNAEDLSSVLALALFEGQGSMQAKIQFVPQNGKQNIEGTFLANDLHLGAYQFEQLLVNSGWQNDPSGAPEMKTPYGYIRVQATSVPYGQINTSVTVTQLETGWELMLAEASWRDNETGLVKAELGASTTMTLSPDGAVRIDDTKLDFGAGSIFLAGQIDKMLALDVRLEHVPLTLVSLLQPQPSSFPIQGEMDGIFHIGGTFAKPQIDFNLVGTGLTTDILQQNNLESLTIKTQGTSDGEIVDFSADMESGAALSATVKGQIALQTQALDIDVELTRGALSALSDKVKALDLGGNLSLSGHIGGTLMQPQGQFEALARQVSSALLNENGLSPLEVTLRGQFDAQRLIVEAFRADGPKGLHFAASGQIPLSGQGLELQADGGVPLALANRFLVARGGQLSGLLQIAAKMSGSLQNPLLSGDFTVKDGEFIDPPSNVQLKNITLEGQMTGETIRLTSLRATSLKGGTLQGEGEISTHWAQGLPANLRLQLDSVRHNDGAMLVATLRGEVTLIGPLLRDFELGGTLEVERMEISLPNLTSQAQEIEVQHKNLDKGRGQAIAATLVRAHIDAGGQGRLPVLQKRSYAPRLNLAIKAPARIFVRGRGLDSELGGAISLGGTLDEPRPSGSFNLIRGRFDVLTKRLEVDEGRITLSGTLDPLLDFTVSTQGNGFDVLITARGSLSDLDINFTSQPELPQDEILAFLLFNRSLGELSPLQIARLAASAAELTGQGGASLIGRLRAATGLDDLDISSDEQGHTGVQAGRYIKDNIYLGVEADSQGLTRGSINLDITESLKAKGSIGSDSRSDIGIFFERDY